MPETRSASETIGAMRPCVRWGQEKGGEKKPCLAWVFPESEWSDLKHTHKHTDTHSHPVCCWPQALDVYLSCDTEKKILLPVLFVEVVALTDRYLAPHVWEGLYILNLLFHSFVDVDMLSVTEFSDGKQASVSPDNVGGHFSGNFSSHSQEEERIFEMSSLVKTSRGKLMQWDTKWLVLELLFH